MTPQSQPQRQKITVRGDSKRNHHVSWLIIFPVPQEDLARMRRYGQLDCGYRQHFKNVQISELPDKVVDQLFAQRLVTEQATYLSYQGAESRGEAMKAAEVITRTAPELFEMAFPDPSVPVI